MLLSIIVPVYNVKEYLIKCLDSINSQTFEDYEVIVVDDGSTDGSGQMVDEYCKDKPKFKVYHKSNGGLMSAWKYGVEQSNGDYIGFVDSDDYIDSTMYEKLHNTVVKYDVEIAFCNHYYVDEVMQKKILHRNPILSGIYYGERLANIRNKMLPLFSKDYISPSRVTKMIRKTLLLNCLKYTDNRVSSGEDVNSMVPCMLQCKGFAYVDEPLYYYIYRKTSISNVFKENLFDTYKIIIDNLSMAAKDCGLDDVLDSELKGLYNLYGFTWLIYILKSNLSYSDKKKQFSKIMNSSDYLMAVKLISKSEGCAAKIYKAAIELKSLSVFLIGMKMHNFVVQMFKR